MDLKKTIHTGRTLPVPVFHRGMWNAEVMENSRRAMHRVRAAAMALPGQPSRCIYYRGQKDCALIGVEFDIQLTKDNQYVVYHDETMSRLHGKNQAIASLSVQEIKEIDEDLLTLDEVVSIFLDKPVLMFVEIKDNQHGRLHQEILKKHFRNDQITFISFSKAIVAQLEAPEKALILDECTNYEVPSQPYVCYYDSWFHGLLGTTDIEPTDKQGHQVIFHGRKASELVQHAVAVYGIQTVADYNATWRKGAKYIIFDSQDT